MERCFARCYGIYPLGVNVDTYYFECSRGESGQGAQSHIPQAQKSYSLRGGFSFSTLEFRSIDYKSFLRFRHLGPK